MGVSSLKGVEFLRIIFFIFVTVLSLDSVACNCKFFTIEEKVNSADFIYFGQVISSELDGEIDVIHKMKIVEVIKGNPDTNLLYSFITPKSDIDTDVCQAYVPTGLTYIVYGKYNEKTKVSRCSTTQPILQPWSWTFSIKKLASIRTAANKQDK